MARVLIVDDDAESANVLADIIAAQGHDPLCIAADIATVRHVRSAEAVDLLIVNVDAGKRPDLGLLKKLLSEPVATGARIAAASVFTDIFSITEILSLGDVCFLGKPYRQLHIAAVLHDVCRRATLQRQSLNSS